MKKLLALLLALVMCCGLLAGCGSMTQGTGGPADSETADTGSTEPVTYELSETPVTLSISWWGGDSRHTAYQEAIAAFVEATPSVEEVTVDFGAWSGWEDKMSTYFASGTAADVCQVNWNWLTSYSSNGQTFMDLNNLSEFLDLTQFDENALAQCTVAGALQCVPAAMTGRIFYWNSETFEKVGVEIPTTYEELIAAGQAFANFEDGSYYPIALGEYDRMILMVYYLESIYGKDWVVDGALNYTEEEIIEGLEFIQSLEDNHVTPTIQQILGDGAESLDKNPKWMDGRYAGIFEWDSSASKFHGALNNPDAFVVGDELGEGGFTKVSLGLAITKTCEHPAEAALLIDYLLNGDGAAIMGSQLGIPLSKSGLEAAGDAVDALTAEANGKVLATCTNALDPKFEDSSLKASDGVYYDVMGGLSYGEYSIEEAAGVLIEGIEDVL